MFEREIQFIYDFNQNKVKKLGAYLTYEQLQDTEIHQAILQYISGEIDFLIFEDRQKLLKESLFDYSGESINNYFSLISNEIKKTKKFSLNYIEKLILHASSFTVNYLSRPKWSILKFIFDEEKTKSALEIKQIFNYFYYYPFLKKIVYSYLDKKKVASLTYDEFKTLLEKIDKISLEANHIKIINESIDSLAEFLNIGLSKRKMIPVKAVELFLQEKSLEPFIVKLNHDFANPEVQRFEADEIKKVLSEVVFETSETGEKEFIDDETNYEVDEPSVRPEKIDIFGDETEPDQEQFREMGTSIPEDTDNNKEYKFDYNEISDTEEPEFEKEEIDDINLEIDEEELIETDQKAGDPDGDLEDAVELIKEQKENIILMSEDIPAAQRDLYAEDEPAEEAELESSFNDVLNNKDIDPAKALYLEETMDIEDTEALDFEIDEFELSEEQPEIKKSDSINEYSDFDKDFADMKTVDETGIFSSEEFKVDQENIKVFESDHWKDILADSNNGLTEDDEEIIEFDEIEDTPKESEIPVTPLENLSPDSLEDENSPDIETEPEESEESDEEPDLFGGKELIEDETDDENESENNEYTEYEKPSSEIKSAVSPKSIDITELLENKKMNKIIDVIFDYDMEDFANAIEKIAVAVDENEALRIVDDICGTAQISTTSREAKTFKSIISDYFKNN